MTSMTRFAFPALLLLAALCLAAASLRPSVFADSSARHPDHLSDRVVYEQPPEGSSSLLQSSWRDPDGSDYDQVVWDDFTLSTAEDITQIRWRGGYDPTHFGMGGQVISFTVAIYPSIAAGIEPDIIHPPLVHYETGNAGETPVGAFGGTNMYDYAFVLPRPLHAEAGVKYWVQIEGWQHGIPDWGLSRGTGGSGGYFRRIAGMGDAFYQRVSGDAAFTLLAADANTPMPTDTPATTATPAASLYLPLLSRTYVP